MEKFPILCPGLGVLFENVAKTSHTREPRSQTFLNRCPKGCNMSTFVYPLASIRTFFMDVALLSISPASHGQLLKCS